MEEHEIIINKAIKFNSIITYMSNNKNVLRDRGLLESAIGSAFQSMFGQDLHDSHEEKAFVLFVNLAKNHPFMDGNKRTAALVTDYYLMEHGLELDLDSIDKFNFMLSILEDNMDQDQALFIFKELVKPIESINRKPLDEESKIEFLEKYEKINKTIESNFDNSLRKNILEKYVHEYSQIKGINFIELINAIDGHKEKPLDNDIMHIG